MSDVPNTAALNLPRPLSLASLDHMPAEFRGEYEQWVDGVWYRRWIPESDQASRLAYLDQILAGTISVLPDGQTPQSVAAEEARRKAESAAILADVESMERADAEKRAGAYKAELAKKRAAEDAEVERMRKTLGRPRVVAQ